MAFASDVSQNGQIDRRLHRLLRLFHRHSGKKNGDVIRLPMSEMRPKSRNLPPLATSRSPSVESRFSPSSPKPVLVFADTDTRRRVHPWRTWAQQRIVRHCKYKPRLCSRARLPVFPTVRRVSEHIARRNYLTARASGRVQAYCTRTAYGTEGTTSLLCISLLLSLDKWPLVFNAANRAAYVDTGEDRRASDRPDGRRFPFSFFFSFSFKSI